VLEGGKGARLEHPLHATPCRRHAGLTKIKPARCAAHILGR
jgi:hypothetical protein